METKKDIRERIWRILEREGVTLFPGTHGRIPNFRGAETAARHLSGLPEWQKVVHIKANPDFPQRSVRHLALSSGKVLYMAVPRLREKKCFVRIDPSRLAPNKFYEASSIKLKQLLEAQRPPPVCRIKASSFRNCSPSLEP